MTPSRHRRWLSVGATSLVIALAAATALLMPRGPMTSTQALAVMGTSLATGVGAGWLLRSRWAVLAVPLTYVLVFELTRLETDGPLVDDILPGSPYGVIALVLGRGVHGLLALAPLLLGAAIGGGAARRRSTAGRAGAGALARRGATVLLGLATAALAVGIARPASTAPLRDADGAVVAGSIAELTQVRAGGHDLGLMLRGRSTSSPVLLFLAGGPGGSERGAMRRHSQALEQDFVVATLDQRGTGTSYDQLDPTATLTPEHAVDDVITVTEHLRERFGQDRVVLVGQSWGSIPAVLAAQRRPDLYRAVVGVGQMVDPLATDRVFYRDTLAWAERTGRSGLARQLVTSGPPPYEDGLDYEAALSSEAEVYPYDRSGNDEGAGGFTENLLVSEYGLLDQAHAVAALLDTFTVLYPRVQDLDLRRDVLRLEVPVFLAQGRHEAPGRAQPAAQWFDALQAPSKQLITFETSGHRAMFEQPGEFHRLMQRVLDET